MNRTYLRLLDAYNQWHFHTFAAAFLCLFLSLFLHLLAMLFKRTPESLPKGALSTTPKFPFEMHHRTNWLSRNSIYDTYIEIV
jgi:hypothetical protein